MVWPKDSNLVHGGARRSGRMPEYYVWNNMRRRCSNPKDVSYKNYGGRGIKVCPRWQNFSAFISDMGRRPTKNHTIERVDNDGNYCPSNCIWATWKVQAKNRRRPKLQTECSRGHPLKGDNVYHRPDGKRGCKTCRRLNMKQYYSKKREQTA